MLLSWWCPFKIKKGKWPTRHFKIIYRLIPLSTPDTCHWTVPLITSMTGFTSCSRWVTSVEEVNQTRVRWRLIYWRTAVNLYTGQVIGKRWPVDCPCGWNAGLTCPNPLLGGGVRCRDEFQTGSHLRTGDKYQAATLHKLHKITWTLCIIVVLWGGRNITYIILNCFHSWLQAPSWDLLQVYFKLYTSTSSSTTLPAHRFIK